MAKGKAEKEMARFAISHLKNEGVLPNEVEIPEKEDLNEISLSRKGGNPEFLRDQLIRAAQRKIDAEQDFLEALISFTGAWE